MSGACAVDPRPTNSATTSAPPEAAKQPKPSIKEDQP